ncbi:MAG: transporter [Nibricoccus sp.]
MKTSSLLALAVVSLTTAAAGRAQLAVSTGFDYSSGKYGLAEKTKVLTWHATAEYSYDAWSTRVYVPYEHVESPAGTVVIAGRPRLTARLNARNQGKTHTESGIGDAEASVSFDACHDLKNDWSAVITGTVKLATGDEEKGLGTGKKDYALGLNLSRNIDRLTPSVGLGYRFVGKPTASDLKDYAYASVGLGWWATDATNLNVSFDSYQPSSKSSGVDNELSFGVNQHLGKHWDIEAHILIGLTDAAPDLGLGCSVSVTF